jgi:hypothetical protein
VNAHYAGFICGFGLLNVVFGSSLFVGGIMALRLNAKGRAFLAAIFIAAIVFELARMPAGAYMQWKITSVIADSMSRMMNTMSTKQSADIQRTNDITAAAMKVGMFVWIGFAVTIGLTKIVFYAVGARYLRQPHIRQLFASADPPAM